MNHKEAKVHIRAFMQAHYTDERLAQLLAHAQEGRLAFNSCCCFIGIATAEHPLNGHEDFSGGIGHYRASQKLPGAIAAETAFNALWHNSQECRGPYSEKNGDIARRRILIPMVRAEMRRREREAIAERAAAVPAQDFAAALISQHMVAK